MADGHSLAPASRKLCFSELAAYMRYLFDKSYTPWSIKKRATFIFSITLANVDGFS